MYNRNNRGSFRSNSHSFRPRNQGGGFSRFGRGGNRGRGRGAPRGEHINYTRFINKAIETKDPISEGPVFNHDFQAFNLDQRLKDSISKKGYKTPTPIQGETIAHALMGRDVLGIANTGTGKTGAFLIPLINKVIQNPKEEIMILAPTRELALQIDQELKGFTRTLRTEHRIFSVCAVGGMSISRQISELKYFNNFVIGTPGRIKDLIQRKVITLSNFKTIVLDEADRMLDMGFVHDMRFLMAGMPKGKQTLFFSATLSPEIEKLIKEFLKDPVKVSVKTRDTSKNVDQDIVKVNKGENKIDILQNLLKKEDLNKVIIFGRTKHGVERLSKELTIRGFKADSIHGNKNHSRRQKALGAFKENRVNILVATDVAARGLDIADVSHVINYDVPATYDDYVHRIGRTGRGDKKGKALTFVD